MTCPKGSHQLYIGFLGYLKPVDLSVALYNLYLHVAVLLDDSHDHNHRLYIAFCLHHAWHKIHKM